MKMDSRVTYEGFGRRLLAGLVDLAFLLIAVATLVLLFLAFSEDPPPLSTLGAELPGFRMHALWLPAVVFATQISCWTVLGATPGMLLLGSQVLGADSGRRLSPLRSCVRCLGLWTGLACLGVGVLWIIRDPRHQGLHDKLASSVVVREDESLLALEELVEGVK
jgi:uncharacterized RDD family membrane protein YckC